LRAAWLGSSLHHVDREDYSVGHEVLGTT
jgi:hypothetical protein